MPSIHWSHLEAAGYIFVLLFMIYNPPRTWWGVGDFIERHFGDSIGMYLLHLGVLLIVLGGVWPSLAAAQDVGKQVFVASMAILKISPDKAQPPPPTTTTTVSTSTVTPPEPPKP